MVTADKVNVKRWVIGMVAGAIVFSMAVPAYADTAAGLSPRQGRVSMVEKLVEDNVISQATGEAIETYLKAGQKERKADAVGEQGGFLADAVSDGIIDQATADKLQEYMTSRMGERRMAQDGSERDKNGKGTGIWEDLLSEGVITQSEYDSIAAAMPEQTLSAE